MSVRAIREDKQWGKDQARLLNDVATVLAPARVLLARVGSSVLSTDDGAPVDLVVSDIRMPGCSGLEVLEKLRDEDWAVPVIVITAFGDLETHQEAMQLGASAMFDKPFDLEDLRVAALNLAPPR